MAKFLENLTDVLGQQLNIGDNKLKTLDTTSNGKTEPYGKLGEFAKKIDQKAERKYLEGGYHRNDLFNPKVNQSSVLFQEPDFTILVKKRLFSSLSENYRNDLISKDEKLFIRATKFLFQNKAKQIAAYEKLSKISEITSKTQTLDDSLLPIIFSATDTLSTIGSLAGSSAFSSFKDVVDRVRTLVNLSDDATNTSWIVNNTDSFSSSLGEGTGVMEFTTAVRFNTTVGVNFGSGSAWLEFTDPLKVMQITSNDIEKAIADATNPVLGASFVQLGLDVLGSTIDLSKNSLNTIRVNRGANPINFIVNPETFLGKRIIAIIDSAGIEIQFSGSLFNVDIDSAYVGVNSQIGNESLQGGEVSLFKQIIQSLYNQLQINKNSQTTQRKFNKDTNKLRQKMLLHYGGQSVIQPMDVIHIYVSSKTKEDVKVLGGVQEAISGVGFLQGINKSLMNLEDYFDIAKDSSIEKSVFVGDAFPNWLWAILRNQFVASKSGTHVFAGVVETTDRSYNNNGTYSLSINCKDNSYYFQMGLVNYQPALNVFNGSLYNPLTPFDIKFDSVTGLPPDGVPELLPENKDLFNSEFAKFKNGIYIGKSPTINNFFSDGDRIKNNSHRRVFYDPDGMVYKWKEGIGTLVMFGNNYQENPVSNSASPPITADPFAGQDVMNVLSLLITGEPYNFATFYQAASQYSDLGRDAVTGQDPSVSYMRNLQTELKSRNIMYGNFIPFKKLEMDSEAYIKNVTAQVRANTANTELNDLLSQKASLQDEYNLLTNGGLSAYLSTNTAANNLKLNIDEIDAKIAAKNSDVLRYMEGINSPVSIVGNDITFQPNYSNSGFNSNDQSDATKQVRLRKKLNFLTRRLAWKVRNNEDVNYFIVDDTYDKDYDIQAFEKSFSNPQLFKSEYIKVSDHIEKVAKLLGLEVFANTQGHIQIRPPQYNRIPSSIFYKMIRMQKEYNIQLYPQFLEDLFVNQLDNALKQIEIVEDELRLYALALGATSDEQASKFFSEQSINNVSNAGLNSNFSFISNQNGNISSVSLDDLTTETDPESILNKFSGQLNALDSIESQSKLNNIFGTSNRIKFLNTVSPLPAGTIFTLSRQNQIIDRLFSKTGVKFDITQVFPNSQKTLAGTTISSVDLLRILNEISTRISKRQNLLKVAISALKSAKQGAALLSNTDNSANKMLSGGLVDNDLIPQSIQYMIEDEGYDDYGPNSGKRFIIKNNQIKSYSIGTRPPSFTAVTVQGTFADNFDVSLPSDLNGFSGGGNALTTAEAVDYDMWKIYGVRNTQSVSAPYLTDPQSQCAPFAVSLLNQARNEVHNGSINIVGNEYMQPGEVVYIEDIDRLYYVTSVRHSINFGGEFSTQLELSAGHSMGEYIPTYLDMVGKVLYKNREITNFVHNKDNSINNEQHIGTFIDSPSSNYSESNKSTFNKILNNAQVSLSSDANASLEFRVYYSSNNAQYGAPSTNALELANLYRNAIIGKQSINNFGAPTSQAGDQQSLSAFASQIPIPDSIAVNASVKTDVRSPSPSAYSLSRDYGYGQSYNGEINQSKIDNILYDKVVDVWITYKPVSNA